MLIHSFIMIPTVRHRSFPFENLDTSVMEEKDFSVWDLDPPVTVTNSLGLNPDLAVMLINKHFQV